MTVRIGDLRRRRSASDLALIIVSMMTSSGRHIALLVAVIALMAFPLAFDAANGSFNLGSAFAKGGDSEGVNPGAILDHGTVR